MQALKIILKKYLSRWEKKTFVIHCLVKEAGFMTMFRMAVF